MIKTTAMNIKPKIETINCPCCHGSESVQWAKENGFTAVKCSNCGLVYVNPRPVSSLIREAVQTGIHRERRSKRTAISRHVALKVILYKKILSSMFKDVWKSPKKISWIDVGAGYGELIEAISMLAPQGSIIKGLEPMRPKAIWARRHGLNVKEEYLHNIKEKFDFLSLVNVFSHIPNFHTFLEDVKNVLTKNGEIFIETGNIGDLISSHEVPTELDLPDHLVFAGEKNIIDYLNKSGFSVIDIRKKRKDGLINFAKNIIKKIIGRQVTLAIPYTSQYRTILIRAKLL